MGLNQLRPIFRRMRQAPAFTLIALATIAIGIGASVAVFSVAEGVMLKPLPYPDPGQLVGVWLAAPGINMPEITISPSTYFVFRDQNRTFQSFGLYTGDSVNVTGRGEPQQVQALRVTDGTLDALGVQPRLGRWFNRADDSPHSPDTAVLTYGYWQTKFGGSRSIIGQSLTINGKPHTVIGVMPRRFSFLDRPDPRLILPLRFDRSKVRLGNYSFNGIARLKPGETLAQASADVARMLPIVNRTFAAPAGFSLKMFEALRLRPNLRPLKNDVVGNAGSAVWILMGSIALVLLIACANVGNLLLVRAEGRLHEFAIRAALGARRSQIAREMLLESLVLGVAGGALGLALGYGALRVLLALAPAGLPRIDEIGIDGHVLLFTLCVTIASSLLFGCVPVFKYAGVHAVTGLREGGRSLSPSRERHRARSVLVVVQVALALVLLISSGLMIQSFRRLTRVDPGFTDPNSVQTFRLSIPESEAAKPQQVATMQREILARLSTIPSVSSAALSMAVPMDGNGSFDPIFIEGRTYAEGKVPPVRRFQYVSPGLLKTLGVPLVAGRAIAWADVVNRIPVVMISENLAREYWRDPASALGHRIRVDTNDPWREIVGVVGNVHDDGTNKTAPKCVYWPFVMSHMYGQEMQVHRDAAFVLRSRLAGSETLMQEVRRAVWSVDPNLPLASVHTVAYFYNKSMARTAFTLVMLAIAGAMSLLLGIIGIYGVVAYSVSQRTREIGIRMALGARQTQLTGLFIRQGVVLAALGVAAGLALAVVLTRFMSSLLFGVRPLDPMSYGAASFLLLAVAVLACYIPARRTAGVNPVEALRAE